MQVKRVTLSDLASTYCCMSEVPSGVSWVDFLPESREWFRKNLGEYVEGYHLLDDGRVVGLIYWASSENALVAFETEPKVVCIYCTELLRDYMHKGYGRMMFDYMKNDLREKGFKGIMVDATDFKEWMHHEFFAKQGFEVIKDHAPFKLMYFPLTQKTLSFRLVELNYSPSRDRVEVTLFDNFFCPVSACMYHLVKKVAQDFGDQVRVVEVRGTMNSVRKYGTTDPLINGKVKFLGPASEETVKKAIQEEIDQLKP